MPSFPSLQPRMSAMSIGQYILERRSQGTGAHSIEASRCEEIRSIASRGITSFSIRMDTRLSRRHGAP